MQRKPIEGVPPENQQFDVVQFRRFRDGLIGDTQFVQQWRGRPLRIIKSDFALQPDRRRLNRV